MWEGDIKMCGWETLKSVGRETLNVWERDIKRCGKETLEGVGRGR